MKLAKEINTTDTAQVVLVFIRNCFVWIIGLVLPQLKTRSKDTGKTGLTEIGEDEGHGAGSQLLQLLETESQGLQQAGCMHLSHQEGTYPKTVGFAFKWQYLLLLKQAFIPSLS